LAPPPRRSDVLALALFLGLAVLQTGIGLDAGSALFVGPDPVTDTWSLRCVSGNLLERPTELWEGNNFFPARDAVLFSEPFLGPALLVAPLRLLTTNPVLLYNVAVLLVLVLASYGCFVLARRITADAGASLLAGILVPYSAHQTYHLNHLNILTIAGFPFLLLGLLLLLERPGPGPAALASLAFAFEAGTSGYHAFSCVFLCLVVAAWGWRALCSRRGLFWAAVAALLAALLLSPFILGFLRIQELRETARAVEENVYYSVDLGRDVLRSRSLLWRWLLRSPGRPLFPGLVALAFASIAVVRRWDPLTRLLLLLAAFFLLLSLGPELRFKGQSLFSLPFRPLFEHLPLFNAGRHPETYVVPAFLALGLLAARGVAASGASRRPWVLALVLLLAAGESLIKRPKREVKETRLPEVYAWLQSQPRGALLEVPFEESEWQWWSLLHGMPIVNGLGAFEPNDQVALFQRASHEWRQQPASDMEERPSLRFLKERFPIRYVVVHRDAPEEYRRNLDATTRSFELVHQGPAGDRVYRLRRGGEGSELRRAFRDDQLRAGLVSATVRGPAGASVVADLNGEPCGRLLLDASPGGLELTAPGARIRRGLNAWRFRLEGAPAGARFALDALEWTDR
jgi:hypothetical protein